MKKLLVLGGFFLMAETAAASCSAIGCDTQVRRLYPSSLADGTVFVEPVDASSGIVNCTLRDNLFFSLKKTHPLFNQIYATLLTATVAKSNVRLRIKEGTPDCEISYVWIVSS